MTTEPSTQPTGHMSILGRAFYAFVVCATIVGILMVSVVAI